MNNQIEGATNAPLRQLLRDHRGMRLTRRIKAIFWWCYMHTENPLPPAQILKIMPTDTQIEAQWEHASRTHPAAGVIPRWATPSPGTTSTTQAPTETTGTNPPPTLFVL